MSTETDCSDRGSEAEETGIPGLIMGTPLGPVLLLGPERTGEPGPDCESVQYLIDRGVGPLAAIEQMQVSREHFYFWKADALPGQLGDVERSLRQYRRRAEKDAREIERLNEIIGCLASDAASPSARI